MRTSRTKPPPSPVVPARTRTPKTSYCLRTATRAPEIANTKMPTRSRNTSVDGMLGGYRLARRIGSATGSHCWRRLGATGIRMTKDRTTMLHLTLAGLSEDNRRLLLVNDGGDQFSLVIDAKLRAALRGEHARLGQLEIHMDSALRPRDIQARIRAGESPDEVAQAAQTTVDRILPYASPVLAEREHIAGRAQRSSVRRKSGGEAGGARTLGEAVTATLRSPERRPRDRRVGRLASRGRSLGAGRTLRRPQPPGHREVHLRRPGQLRDPGQRGRQVAGGRDGGEGRLDPEGRPATGPQASAPIGARGRAAPGGGRDRPGQ